MFEKEIKIVWFYNATVNRIISNGKRYTNKLIQYKDNDFVKVITGVRRLEKGVSDNGTISYNFESHATIDLRDDKVLYESIAVELGGMPFTVLDRPFMGKIKKI